MSRWLPFAVPFLDDFVAAFDSDHRELAGRIALSADLDAVRPLAVGVGGPVVRAVQRAADVPQTPDSAYDAGVRSVYFGQADWTKGADAAGHFIFNTVPRAGGNVVLDLLKPLIGPALLVGAGLLAVSMSRGES